MVDFSRSASHVWKERGLVWSRATRDFVERATRRRWMLGYLGAMAASWLRKWRPTPPAPEDI